MWSCWTRGLLKRDTFCWVNITNHFRDLRDHSFKTYVKWSFSKKINISCPFRHTHTHTHTHTHARARVRNRSKETSFSENVAYLQNVQSHSRSFLQQFHFTHSTKPKFLEIFLLLEALNIWSNAFTSSSGEKSYHSINSLSL